MNLKRLSLAAAAGVSLLAAAPAFADPPHWAPAHGWRAQHHYPHYYYRAPAYVYYPARPVVIAPPPPAYYYAPAPVIYGRIPVNPDLQIGFRVRL
jgi:hypothetical protein